MLLWSKGLNLMHEVRCIISITYIKHAFGCLFASVYHLNTRIFWLLLLAPHDLIKLILCDSPMTLGTPTCGENIEEFNLCLLFCFMLLEVNKYTYVPDFDRNMC